MVKGFFRHFKGKEYRAIGTGVFRAHRKDDPFFDFAFDSEDPSRQIHVYVGAEAYVLEDIGGVVRPAGLVYVLYRAQYSDEKLGDKPLFVRSRDDFLANVDINGYKGPRFISVNH